METQAQRLFVLLREMVECCQEGEQMQARLYGLTTAQARTLVAIRFHNCRTTADLADALFVAKSRVTRIIDSMERDGLVKRAQHSDDRRICLIHLTPRGNETTEKLMSFILLLHDDVLSALPDGFRRETLSVMSALKEAMNGTRARLRQGYFEPAEPASVDAA